MCPSFRVCGPLDNNPVAFNTFTNISDPKYNDRMKMSLGAMRATVCMRAPVIKRANVSGSRVYRVNHPSGENLLTCF